MPAVTEQCTVMPLTDTGGREDENPPWQLAVGNEEV